MHAFAKKPNVRQPAASASSMFGRTHPGQNHEHLAPRADAPPRQTEVNTAASEAETTAPSLDWNFGRIPVHAPAPARLQAKLELGMPRDIHEQEADRVADQVMRMPEPKERSKAPADISGDAIRPAVQTKSTHAGDSGGIAAPPIVHDVLRSPGQPLAASTRAFMEPRFGQDFRDVRVHTDATAAQSAAAIGAYAFTLGRHIAFAPGQYAPATESGTRLLAHELTHVAQQRGRMFGEGGVVQRKANAIRFQDEPTLDEISDGKKTLKRKDKGEAVIRISTALSELTFYTALNTLDEVFGSNLETAVTKYQDTKGLKGKVPAGAVEKRTFGALDADFSASYRPERDVLSKQKKPDLLKQTQGLDAAENAAGARTISTEVKPDPVTHLPPTFRPDIPGKGKYEDRLKTLVEAIIVRQFNAMGKDKAKQHADQKNLVDWPKVETIALQSQAAVDAVFKEYNVGGALTAGVKIFDAWDAKVSELAAGGKAAEDSSANRRVEKILNGNTDVQQLDTEHGAIKTRPPEKSIVDRVKSALVSKYRTELLETHKGWPGYEKDDKVFIQRFQGSTDDEKKNTMWKLYQTFIHEYLHSLEHKDYRKFREAKDEQKGGFALREGTTDYFTKIVWSSITIDDALRKKIEGTLNDPSKKFAVPPLTTYPEAKNAERLAGVVGIRNLAAAFFLGKVDLIGK